MRYSTGPSGRDKAVEMPFAMLVVSVVVVLSCSVRIGIVLSHLGNREMTVMEQNNLNL